MTIDEYAKTYNGSAAKYLGVFEGNQAYLLVPKTGNNDGSIYTGLPFIVVEKKGEFELLNGKDLVSAMNKFFKLRKKMATQK